MSWAKEIEGIEDALEILRADDPIAAFGAAGAAKTDSLRRLMLRARALFDVAMANNGLKAKLAPSTVAEFDADRSGGSVDFAILCHCASLLGSEYKEWLAPVVFADPSVIEVALASWRAEDIQRDATMVEQLRGLNSRGCESPIEERMLRALRRLFPNAGPWALAGERASLFHARRGPWHLVGQHEASGYRLDFAAITDSHLVAIECDGHDYHERTKEQARHDRSRDRALQAAGWSVLRFTGSEIHENADACASEVVRFLDNLELAL